MATLSQSDVLEAQIKDAEFIGHPDDLRATTHAPTAARDDFQCRFAEMLRRPDDLEISSIHGAEEAHQANVLESPTMDAEFIGHPDDLQAAVCSHSGA